MEIRFIKRFVGGVFFLSLPIFAYTPHESHRLPPEELIQKREGYYATGLPLVSYDPVRGLGGGARISVFSNGRKDHKYFAFTPYQWRVTGQLYESREGVKNHFIQLDIPYIADTPFRLRTSLSLDDNPQTPFFGIGSGTMAPLRARDTGRLADFATYEESLNKSRPGTGGEAAVVTDAYRNTYHFHSVTLFQVIEYNFLSAWRGFFATEFSRNRIYDRFGDRSGDDNLPVGKTLLTELRESGSVIGARGGQVNYFRVGVAWDTRDYEPDPHRGLLAETSFTAVSPRTGSDFSYRKAFSQVKWFLPVLPATFHEVTLASRAAVSWTSTGAPFSEVRYMWSVDGPMTGLGGLNTLRGFRQDRFVGHMMAFTGLELRTRVASGRVAGQDLALSLVPFLEAGRVWTHSGQFGFRDYAVSGGMGMRLVWNDATVILADYAVSQEDRQFFIDMQHAF